jgi:hypothetical protein
MKELVFKKGDNVFHAAYGWGKVISIDEEDKLECPVEVQFHNWGCETFTHDGRTMPGYPMVLSFTAYTLEGFSQERPEELPELGDVVWVRDKDSDEWEVSHFYKKDHLGYHVSNDMISYHVAIWSQLRKTNPYKNEETEA